MPYVGRTPSAVPVTADDIPANSIDASKIIDGAIAVADVADNAITEAKIADAAVVSLKSGRKNLIINGGFDVWQRGTSTTSVGANYYTVDRVWTYNPGANTIQQSSSVPSGEGFIYSLNATTSISALGVAVELPATGKTMLKANTDYTLSFWAKSDVAATIGVHHRYRDAKASGTNNVDIDTQSTASITTSWARHTTTFNTGSTVPAATSKIIDIELSVSSLSNSYITGVQLELGSVATDFEHRSFGEELALCQRYYQQVERTRGSGNRDAGINVCAFSHALKVEMRTTPTMSFIAQGSDYNYTNNVFENVTSTSVAALINITTADSYWYYNHGYKADAEL